MSDFHNERYVRVSKPHVCEWCGKRIPAGSMAGYISGKFNGDFYTRYVHFPCELLAHQLNMFDPYYGLDRDGWNEAIRCEYENIVRESEGALKLGAQFDDQLKEVIRKHIKAT